MGAGCLEPSVFDKKGANFASLRRLADARRIR